MEFYVTETDDGTFAVIWDAVFTGWPINNLVHGNFKTLQEAEDYAETVAKVIRER